MCNTAGFPPFYLPLFRNFCKKLVQIMQGQIASSCEVSKYKDTVTCPDLGPIIKHFLMENGYNIEIFRIKKRNVC